MRKTNIIMFNLLLFCTAFFGCSNDISDSKIQTESSTMALSETHDKVDFSNSTENQLNLYFDLCKEAVETYYVATFSEAPKFSSFNYAMTDDVKKYLGLKFKYDTASNSERKYINGDYTLVDWKTINDSLLCKINADISFQYPTSVNHSGMGMEIQIIIQNPNKPTITDWYIGDPASFDSQVRGSFLDLSNSDHWLSNQNIDNIIKKGNELVSS